MELWEFSAEIMVISSQHASLQRIHHFSAPMFSDKRLLSHNDVRRRPIMDYRAWLIRGESHSGAPLVGRTGISRELYAGDGRPPLCTRTSIRTSLGPHWVSRWEVAEASYMKLYPISTTRGHRPENCGANETRRYRRGSSIGIVLVHRYQVLDTWEPNSGGSRIHWGAGGGHNRWWYDVCHAN